MNDQIVYFKFYMNLAIQPDCTCDKYITTVPIVLNRILIMIQLQLQGVSKGLKAFVESVLILKQKMGKYRSSTGVVGGSIIDV